MDDRQLLELAAKAAGIEIKSVIGDTFWTPDGITWNPLAEDGDALRLAVKLRMTILCNTTNVDVSVRGFSRVLEQYSNHKLDENAATRRAIVRAAAEIGKQL